MCYNLPYPTRLCQHQRQIGAFRHGSDMMVQEDSGKESTLPRCTSWYTTIRSIEQPAVAKGMIILPCRPKETHTQVQGSYWSHQGMSSPARFESRQQVVVSCCNAPWSIKFGFFFIPLPTWNKPNHHCIGKTEIQESSIPWISHEILWKSIVYWGLASYFIPTAGSNLSPFSKPRDRKRRVDGLGSDYTQVRSHWAWPHHWRGSVIPTSCETCCKTRQDESYRVIGANHAPAVWKAEGKGWTIPQASWEVWIWLGEFSLVKQCWFWCASTCVCFA